MNVIKSIGSRVVKVYSEKCLYGVYMIGVQAPVSVQDVNK